MKLCRIGLHKWGKWELRHIVNVTRAGRRIPGTRQTRVCLACGLAQTRRAIT